MSQSTRRARTTSQTKHTLRDSSRLVPPRPRDSNPVLPSSQPPHSLRTISPGHQRTRAQQEELARHIEDLVNEVKRGKEAHESLEREFDDAEKAHESKLHR